MLQRWPWCQSNTGLFRCRGERLTCQQGPVNSCLLEDLHLTLTPVDRPCCPHHHPFKELIGLLDLLEEP